MNKDERLISTNFGALIKSRRKSKNMTLKEVAELSNVSSSYLSRLEISEKRTPSYKVMVSICNALKISLDELMDIAVNDSERSLKSIGDLIITNDFNISGKRATRQQKEAIIELLEFVTERETRLSSINDRMLEEISKTIVLAKRTNANL